MQTVRIVPQSFLANSVPDYGHEKILLGKRMTSIIIWIMALHFFPSLSMVSCILLSTVWWMWSRSVGSYHLFKHSRWTSEFSWSNKQGFKRQEALKGLETNRQLFSDRNILQQKRDIILHRFWIYKYQPWFQNLFSDSASCKTLSLTDNSKLLPLL